MANNINVEKVLVRIGDVIGSQVHGEICAALGYQPQSYASWVKRKTLPLLKIWLFAEEHDADFRWLITGQEPDPLYRLVPLFTSKQTAYECNKSLLTIDKDGKLKEAAKLLYQLKEDKELPIISNEYFDRYPELHILWGALQTGDPADIRYAGRRLSNTNPRTGATSKRKTRSK